MDNFWRSVNLKGLEIPEEILSAKESVTVSDGFKTIEGTNVYYREVTRKAHGGSDVSLLLLHGKMFSSKTWLDLGTIHVVGAMGHHVVAVDLPGYGNSPKSNIADKAGFLNNLLTAFHLEKAAIVSPSMSGFYTLPFLLKYSSRIVGYIPVAPVGIEVLEERLPAEDQSIVKFVYEPLKEFLVEPIPDLDDIRTPTMVVFGEHDRSRSSALLSLLPNSQCQEIPGGGHPAYLKDPDLWHKLLYNFLHRLSETS